MKARVDSLKATCKPKKVTLSDLRHSNIAVDAEKSLEEAINTVFSEDGMDTGSFEVPQTVSLTTPVSGKRKLIKSGMKQTASDFIINPMLWPQSVLQYEFVSKEIKFKELSFNLFVAGELEIICPGLISR